MDKCKCEVFLLFRRLSWEKDPRFLGCESFRGFNPCSNRLIYKVCNQKRSTCSLVSVCVAFNNQTWDLLSCSPVNLDVLKCFPIKLWKRYSSEHSKHQLLYIPFCKHSVNVTFECSINFLETCNIYKMLHKRPTFHEWCFENIIKGQITLSEHSINVPGTLQT